MNRRTALVSVAIAIMVACSGITAAAVANDFENTSRGEEKSWEHNQWKNLNLIENIYPEYSLNGARDNFYGYAWNDVFTDPSVRDAPDKESAMEALEYLDVSYYADYEAADIIERVFAGDGGYSGHDADVMHRYHELDYDMAARNAVGFSCIRDSVEQIWAINSLDELSEFMKTGGHSLLTDAFVYEEIRNNYLRGGGPSVYLNAAFVGMNVDHGYQPYRFAAQVIILFLMLADPVISGYLGIDEDTASELTMDMRAFEYDLITELYSRADNPIELNAEQLAEQVFPFASDAKIYTDMGCDSFIIGDWTLEVMNGIWDQSNLDIFKTVLLCKLFSEAALHLDDTAYGYFAYAFGLSSVDPLTTLWWDTTNQYSAGSLLAAQFYSKEMDKTYPALKSDVTELAESIISEGKRYLTGLDRLSEESKKNIADKCDSIRVYSLHPDSWDPWNYGYIDDPYGEDCFYDYYVKMKHVVQEALAADSVDVSDDWKMYCFVPQYYNAQCSLEDNSIVITYSYAANNYPGAVEEQYAGVAEVIAHEFSHMFGLKGCGYDKDGVLNGILTEDDENELLRHADALIGYLNGFDLGITDGGGKEIFMDGKKVIEEYLSDLTGLKILLDLAKGTEDFDYKEFFRLYALKDGVFADYETVSDLLSDEHPFSTYRVNVDVQMFDEFYEAYGVTEGDGMYLPPDRRVLIWA